MLEAILRAAGRRAVAAGNVGLPLVDAVARPTAPYDVLAVELSSFQLHWSSSLRPPRAARCSTSPTTTSTGTARFDAYAARQGADLAPAPGRRASATPTTRVARRAGRRVTRPAGRRFTLGAPRPGQLGVRRTACWSTARSPTTGEATELGDLADLTSRRPAQRRQRPRRRRAGPGLRRRRRGGRARAARPSSPEPHRNALVADASTASTTSTTARRPTRTRPRPRSPPTTPVVWIAGGLLKGADVDALVARGGRRLRRRRSCSAPTGPRSPRARATRPDVPVVDGRQRRDDWRR